MPGSSSSSPNKVINPRVEHPPICNTRTDRATYFYPRLIILPFLKQQQQEMSLVKAISGNVKAISGTGDGLVDDALLQAILKRTSESPIHTQGKQHRQSGPPSSHTQQHPPSNGTSSQPSHNKQQQRNNQAFKLPCTQQQEITKHAQSNQLSSLVNAISSTGASPRNNNALSDAIICTRTPPNSKPSDQTTESQARTLASKTTITDRRSGAPVEDRDRC